MQQLFAREEEILQQAKAYAQTLADAPEAYRARYEALVREYGRLLRQLNRVTKLTDRTTEHLHTTNLDLRDRVQYDTLTGVHSRAYMDEMLGALLRSLVPTGGSLAVLMVDIDYFKQYNDTYGHQQGDECLKLVAQALLRSIDRPGDFVARYGGEEFLLVLPNTNRTGSIMIAERILHNICASNIAHEASCVAPCVTVSVGVTSGVVLSGYEECDYIAAADNALYQAKHGGRNTHRYAEIGG